MRIGPQRPLHPDAIAAPPGYRVEPVVTGLSFPTAVSFGPGGELYLAERGGVQHLQVSLPRVLRVDPDRRVIEIGRLENPIVGLAYRNGELMIAEDGPAPRVLRVTAEGNLQILVEGLPGGGDYGLSGLTLDGSGALLFGLGTRTNSGVVGPDNVARGWVTTHPDWCDVPGTDATLAGVNYVTNQPGGSQRSVTGGFRPYRRRSEPGETVRGSRLAGGSVYRLPVDGGGLERLCTGLRNPLGVAVAPDGRVFATEGGMEERGSRPIAGAPDSLWEIRRDAHYGWPDYAASLTVTDPRYRLPGHPQPRPLLSNLDPPHTRPTAVLPARSGIGGLDFSTAADFGFVGDAIVALAGEWTFPAYPPTDSPAACRIVRVNPRSGEVGEFLSNRGEAQGGLLRPVDVRFDPSGEALFIVDLGDIALDREYGLLPYGGTGVIWRVTRVRSGVVVPGRRDDRSPVTAEDESGLAAADTAGPDGSGLDELALWARDSEGREDPDEFPPIAPLENEEPTVPTLRAESTDGDGASAETAPPVSEPQPEEPVEEVVAAEAAGEAEAPLGEETEALSAEGVVASEEPVPAEPGDDAEATPAESVKMADDPPAEPALVVEEAAGEAETGPGDGAASDDAGSE